MPCRKGPLEKEASQEQQAEQNGQSVYDDFDKTHEITYSCQRVRKRLRPKGKFSSGQQRMSKSISLSYIIPAAALLVLQFFTFGYGQKPAEDINATISLDAGSRAIKVEVLLKQGFAAGFRRNLGFRRSAAGFRGLTARLRNLEIIGNSGQPVSFTKVLEGEYLADADFGRVSYGLDLSSRVYETPSAHFSWLDDRKGMLMLADILPVIGLADRPVSAYVEIRLPNDWKAFGTPFKTGLERAFSTPDAGRSVILIGTEWELAESASRGPQVRLVSSGEWAFSQSDAAGFAAEILNEYRRLFGGPAVDEAIIVLVRLPTGAPHGNWQAETRGRTITIASSDMPDRISSRQLLHEQLRHELFHLWLPNGVMLSGNYGWFYEGFGLYQALKTGVWLNRISFDDMLSTLGRAYQIERSQRPLRSLVDASRARFEGDQTEIYGRGMLVAFLCDLVLLEDSNGKTGIEVLLRELFRSHRHRTESSGANEAIIELMNKRRGLRRMAEDHVLGKEPIDLERALTAAGIEQREANGRVSFAVTERPGRMQRTILDRLGYNRWRSSRRYQNAN